MRSLCCLILLAASAAQAQDLADTCGASSSYDLTLAPDHLLFDRAAPAPRRVELRDGKLDLDGKPLRLNAEQVDRLALFEHDLRALAPKAKAVARDGVDLAAQALRAEAKGLQLGADTQARLDATLDARSAELKRRVDASTSTHDWQDEAFERWADQIAAELLPLIAADLGAQALDAASSGDLQTAASLRDRAADLAGDLRPRLERRLQALKPRIAALCPSIRHLYELQQGVRGANGRTLDLLELDGAR
ncbi:DUF2884 family protein [Dokdonella sp.]|uniref:DUF2884 family protein n=1 Tax=Dokdonella sp. TaxID=2291710 RepID=UPI001B0E88A5|nr:DUF2884 family protein [Dokdonella sp.]MBO9662124.1 DUF2884 family protein [Dokdonella sp.]